jgi:alcohol dehydrogenase
MTPAGSRPNWLKLAWRYMKRPRADPLAMISTNKSIMAFNLIWLFDNTEMVNTHFDAVLGASAALGRPHIDEASFGFEEVPAALRRLQSGKSIGKVVVSVA